MPIFVLLSLPSNQTAVGITPGEDVIPGISIKIESLPFSSWKAITVLVFPKSRASVPEKFFSISNYSSNYKFV